MWVAYLVHSGMLDYMYVWHPLLPLPDSSPNLSVSIYTLVLEYILLCMYVCMYVNMYVFMYVCMHTTSLLRMLVAVCVSSSQYQHFFLVDDQNSSKDSYIHRCIHTYTVSIYSPLLLADKYSCIVPRRESRQLSSGTRICSS